MAQFDYVPEDVPAPKRRGRRPRQPQDGQQTLGVDAGSPPTPRAQKNGKNNGNAFEQAFKNIDDVLWKEAGCTTELDYTEQTSWLLFLKYLDGLEQDRATEAALRDRPYTFLLDEPYRWDSWAAPRVGGASGGPIDRNRAMTGDDLRDFVNQKLFPYLHGFKQRASGPNTIEYKIGEIFGEIRNKISSGYNLREIIDHIDELRFRSQREKHELSHLYEGKIARMAVASTTPRARSSAPSSRSWTPRWARPSTTGPAGRQASCVRATST